MLYKSSTLRERIPQQAIANDNFIGFVSSFWHEYQPRWIELAAATPVWTSLMAFYVEGDKGHLMNNQARRVHTTLSLSRQVSPPSVAPQTTGSSTHPPTAPLANGSEGVMLLEISLQRAAGHAPPQPGSRPW